ncbi:MAG: hypothetical protein A3K19_18480 [Lentisphaerae bacterium RIFOXYB12_FULL_65_16]|nr:MAG: hypothetical protein A3K18_13805 [Lentisphaerae bacterium RIFOXYA12_64_32]OGV92949.1 MAG: hypothetical protein A3K19_18480 [Lentisphaerae bacterium RIFOXYB12_FULL_65_16]
MRNNPHVFHIRFMFGRGVNHRQNPHHVDRPGGTDIWILEYTASGRGRIRTRGEDWHATPGDIIIFRPEVPQDYGMDPETGDWDHLWVCFAPRPAWLELLHWPERTPGILRLTLPRELQGRVQTRLEEGIDLMRGPLKRREDLAMNLLEGVLLWCDTANPANAQARLDPRIRQALAFICDNYDRRITLAELATCAGLSPSRFSHLFREQTGQTPWQCLEQQRLARAGELLLMSGKTIAEIARQTGFPNPFYFSRVFARRHQRSPRAFRRQQPGR